MPEEESKRINEIREKSDKTKRVLRTGKLENGHPFLCFEEHLPDDQAIYEYPDGRFEVVKITGVLSPKELVRLATPAEIKNLKKNNPAYPEYYIN